MYIHNAHAMLCECAQITDVSARQVKRCAALYKSFQVVIFPHNLTAYVYGNVKGMYRGPRRGLCIDSGLS